MTDMEIETFLTVLRSGSMTAAAQALYITQPTLSARLQTLEDEVGTPLFVRGKGLRRLELTEAGTRFLPLAQRWRKLTDEMHGIAAAEARTHFRIGAAYSIPDINYLHSRIIFKVTVFLKQTGNPVLNFLKRKNGLFSHLFYLKFFSFAHCFQKQKDIFISRPDA